MAERLGAVLRRRTPSEVRVSKQMNRSRHRSLVACLLLRSHTFARPARVPTAAAVAARRLRARPARPVHMAVMAIATPLPRLAPIRRVLGVVRSGQAARSEARSRDRKARPHGSQWARAVGDERATDGDACAVGQEDRLLRGYKVERAARTIKARCGWVACTGVGVQVSRAYAEGGARIARTGAESRPL